MTPETIGGPTKPRPRPQVGGLTCTENLVKTLRDILKMFHLSLLEPCSRPLLLSFRLIHKVHKTNKIIPENPSLEGLATELLGLGPRHSASGFANINGSLWPLTFQRTAVNWLRSTQFIVHYVSTRRLHAEDANTCSDLWSKKWHITASAAAPNHISNYSRSDVWNDVRTAKARLSLW